MKFDKPKYLKLVEFIRANKGRVFALYTPKAGTMIQPKGMEKQELKKIPGLKNKEALIYHCKHYINNYRLYPDEPQLEFSDDYTQLRIKNSWKQITTITKSTL
tara:strand:- start:305 stop:613 length:309 start_codon:yes stop_codon:yes gene_type:complete